MKDHLGAVLRSFAAALCSAALCLLTIALMLALYDVERTFLPACAQWALFLLVQAAVCELLVSRGASMLVYLAVNAALTAACVHTVTANTAFIPGSNGFPVLLGWMVSACGMHLTYAAQKLPGSNFFVRYADVLIASVVLYLASVFGLSEAFHTKTLGFALLALILAMMTTASLRAGGESDSVIRGTGIGGWLVLGALVFLCLILTAAVISVSSGHVDGVVSFLVFLWQHFCAACRLLLNVLARIIALFAGKPKAYRNDPPAQQSDMPDMGAVEIAAAPDWIVYVFIALIVGLIAFAVIAVLYMLHGTKLSHRKRARSRRKVTRQSHFLQALRELVQKTADMISFEIAWRRHRRTPQGLYVLARRTGMLHKLPQKRSESAGAYLRRYHQALLEKGSDSALDALSAQLDEALYGGQTIRLTAQEYERYAAQIASLRASKSQP